MRIDTLTIKNFKKYEDFTIDFGKQKFILLVGDNGSGKTTILDALAVAMGIWLVKSPPGMKVSNTWYRNIETTDVRLVATQEGDRVVFRACLPTVVTAFGDIGNIEGKPWTRQIREDNKRANGPDAKKILAAIKEIYRRDQAGEKVVCPVLAYYGAGRAWLPSNDHNENKSKVDDGGTPRWAAFYDCFNERIREGDLIKWFAKETMAAGNRSGKMRPGFEVVKWAILKCVPGADRVWYDPDRNTIILSISGQAQPFDNLSAGQKMMLAMVADIAIKAVKQNGHLLPPDELGAEDTPVPRLLAQTPGVVLIDELDVHLHPKWQRRVASDLKQTFPNIQFVCTSHSPQVIGEVKPEEIRRLDVPSEDAIPCQSFGMDSNWVLEVLMGASDQDQGVKDDVSVIAKLIADRRFEEAQIKIAEIRQRIGNNEAIQKMASRIDRIRMLGK